MKLPVVYYPSMGVSLEIYRAAIGLFNGKVLCICQLLTSFSLSILLCGCLFTFILILSLLIILSGNVETNPGPPKSLTLNIGHINARSLNVEDKFEEIVSLVLEQKLDIFAVSETWLNHLIPSESLHIPGFSPMFRLDRSDGRRAGGVALFTSSSIVAKRRIDLERNGIELLWVEMQINRHFFVCGVCYRPPNSNCSDNIILLDHLQFCLDQIYSKPNTFVLLLGDFNAHYDIDNPADGSDFGLLLYRWMGCNSLFQIINEVTRVTARRASILDLIITNSPGYFVDSGTISPPSNCDHSLIFARMNISLAKSKCYKRLIWDLSNVDESRLLSALMNVHWDDVFVDVDDVDTLYNRWLDCFRLVLQTYVPNRTVVIRPQDKPWINSEVRRAIRKRNRLLKTFCHYKNPETWELYRQQRNFTTSLIRRRKLSYYSYLNEKLQHSSLGPKKWWGIIKRLYGSKIKLTVPTLLEGDSLVSDAKDKATLLNDYFCSQSKLSNEDAPLPTLRDFQNSKTLSVVSTSEQEVGVLLKNVDTSKACGVDGIGNSLIRMCATAIAPSLASFFNISFSRGHFPSAWKFANVVPIFKKDNRQLKGNYRPVSLLTSLSKIIEKIVFIRLYNFLLEIHFFSPFQSGFRPGDSTVNQLVLIVHKIYEALEQGKEVRMVYLDMSKAFDRVWHKGLLFKLESLGVRDPLLSWIRSYLTNRKQRVVIDGQSSNWREMEAGVPQGSVLGPLLFLVYINDIVANLQCNCFLYADDTSLFDIVDDPQCTAVRLNDDLESIRKWTRDWFVTINAGKTESMIFSVKRHKPQHSSLYYNNEVIKTVSNHKHLGVTLSSNLSWRAHILNIHEKASKRLNLLKGLKFKINRDTLAKLYICLIRPVMEYADVVWDGCSESISDLLESVQYESARVVTGSMRGTSRRKLLDELAWEDLKTRRSMHKLVLFFKIGNNLTPGYLSDILTLTTQQRSGLLLRSAYNFTLFPCHTERFKKSFFPATTRLWNSLDHDFRTTDSLSCFKRYLINFFDISIYEKHFNFSLDRYSSILHTRLRLNCCALNYYLFKINCIASPACNCGANYESVNHYLLYCPRYAALRFSLHSAAAEILGDSWYHMSDSVKLKIFLFGSDKLTLAQNNDLFFHVQQYIKQSGRFS